jgi:threonine synthase
MDKFAWILYPYKIGGSVREFYRFYKDAREVAVSYFVVKNHLENNDIERVWQTLLPYTSHVLKNVKAKEAALQQAQIERSIQAKQQQERQQQKEETDLPAEEEEDTNTNSFEDSL